MSPSSRNPAGLTIPRFRSYMSPVSRENEEQGGERDGDLFHRGVVTKLFPSNNLGLVRTRNGREIPFSFDLVILVGDKKR